MIRRPFFIPALILMAISTSPSPSADALVADLSDNLIAITAGFTGTELLLFGTMERNSDIVVVVHGPLEEVVVRKKERIAGIWMNTDGMIFKGVPAFYHVATTEGAALDIPISTLQRHQIGVENIRMEPPIGRTDEEVKIFQDSIVRLRQSEGLYTKGMATIDRRGQRLFRTKVLFPANVPVGTYIIETLMVRNGAIESAQTTPLFVNKVGAGAEIFQMARNQSALYGIASILIAGIAGYGANWLFKRLG